MKIENRLSKMLGVDYPIVQAPMGWIARSQLASAVSNAGGLGIIETSSGELDAVREEIKKMKRLTTKPFGVNIALAFVRDPNIVKFVDDAVAKGATLASGGVRSGVREISTYPIPLGLRRGTNGTIVAPDIFASIQVPVVVAACSTANSGAKTLLAGP